MAERMLEPGVSVKIVNTSASVYFYLTQRETMVKVRNNAAVMSLDSTAVIPPHGKAEQKK